MQPGRITPWRYTLAAARFRPSNIEHVVCPRSRLHVGIRDGSAGAGELGETAGSGLPAVSCRQMVRTPGLPAAAYAALAIPRIPYPLIIIDWKRKEEGP